MKERAKRTVGDVAFDATAASGSLTALASTATVCTMLSCAALPIYAKLAYEGACCTAGPRKYLIRGPGGASSPSRLTTRAGLDFFPSLAYNIGGRGVEAWSLRS